MDKGTNTIQTFTDLVAWQKGHSLVLVVYGLTKKFPQEEVFGLVMQLRRAMVSVTSNIAEGFSRATYADKSRFYSMALGSVTEVQNQLIIARDLGYISEKQYTEVNLSMIELHKLMNGLIKKTRSFKS